MKDMINIDKSKFKDLNMPPRLLLGPGPSMVDPRILRVMASPLVGHLDPKFLELMDQIKEMLQYLFVTKNPLTIPISGTGSAGMEAAIANMVEPGDDVLICINGYFGERLADMAGRYRANVQTIKQAWGQAFDPEDIRKALKEKPAKIVGIVHAETSTGVMQPLDDIIRMVHDQGGIIIVDAVTSLGGAPLFIDEQSIDVCYSGTQKCLGCPPSLSPITLGPRAEERLSNRQSIVPNWYLDLSVVQKYWGKERTYHHTAPITANYALYEALRLVIEEGLENRWARHQQNAEMLWEGLEAIGLECLVDRQYRLPSLTTIKIPEGVDDMAVRGRLLSEYNIEIAGGLGDLKGKVWRIGLMGYSSRKENVVMILEALRRILNR